MSQGKSPTGRVESRVPVTDARIVELVSERRQASLRYNYTLFTKLQSYYNTYRGVWQGQLSQFRNNITIPFTFAMIQSDVARKVQTSFGSWPVVTFEGTAPEDVAVAKKREVLISAQMRDCKSISKAIDFFLSADICGTGIARFGWKNVTRKQRYTRYEDIVPGLRIPVMYERDATVFDGPDWTVIDRLDFWQQPGIKRLDDMDWVIHRYWMDLDAMREDAASEYPYFDAAAVRSLESFQPGAAMDQYIARRVAFRNEYDYQARANERFAKPVEIWEMHGLVPSEFAPDGIRMRCIAIANGRVVVKNRESVLPSGQKPFLAVTPMSDPYSFDGIGKAEVAFGPQQTANRLNNQKLDALDQLIDPMWLASSSAGINFQNLFTRAGRIITVDGAADDSNIRALVPNMQGVSMVYQEIPTLFNFLQLGTGETEAVMGTNVAGNRETARGFLGRQENALTRLAMEATAAEQDMVEPLADGFVALNRQFLPLPYMPKILGSMSRINPVTGIPYPAERVTIDQDDLAADYASRAVGASQMMGRGVRQQNFVSLMQVLNSNPAMMQLVNWYAFARQAFELFDFRNVDELLVQQQIPMLNQLAAQGGLDPAAAAGMLSQPLDQLSPDIIGQVLGGQNQSPIPAMAGA